MASTAGSRFAFDSLRFWLPIALIASAVWVSDTTSRNVTFGSDTMVSPQDEVESVAGSNLGRQLLFPALGVTGVLLWWRSNRRPLSHPLLAKMAIVLVILVGASALWSVQPTQSLKRVSVVYCTAMAAIGIGRTWSARDLCRAALIISSLFVGVSILYELRAGSFLSGQGYRFSGAFHPNQQAVITGVLALSSLCLFRDSGRYRYLAVAVLGIVLVKLTGSRGCILGLIFAVAVMYWIGMSRTKQMASVIACGMVFAVGLILLSVSGKPAPSVVEIASMGRVDASDQADVLNGRLAIWDEVIGDISERPLLGYGYGAFWDSDRVFAYSWIHDWGFSNAHSVYLETALDIGIVGLVVAFAVALIAWTTSLRIFSRTDDWGVMFISSLICMGMISGLIDVMFVRVGFATILLAIGVVILSMYPVRQPGAPAALTVNGTAGQQKRLLHVRNGQGDIREGSL